MSTRVSEGDVVEVHWVDSLYMSGWTPPEDVHTFATDPDVVIHSIGYLYHKDRKYVVLEGHHSTYNDESEGLMRIPRGAIHSITLIRKKEHSAGRKNKGNHRGCTQPSIRH